MRLSFITLSLIAVFAVFSVLFSGQPAAAADGPTRDLVGLRYAEATGLSDTDPRFVTARIINVLLSVLGILSVVLIVYAGFMWMTAAGDSGKVDNAKKIITASVIGLVIILSAYSISRFVVTNLTKATSGYEYVE